MEGEDKKRSRRREAGRMRSVELKDPEWASDLVTSSYLYKRLKKRARRFATEYQMSVWDATCNWVRRVHQLPDGIDILCDQRWGLLLEKSYFFDVLPGDIKEDLCSDMFPAFSRGLTNTFCAFFSDVKLGRVTFHVVTREGIFDRKVYWSLDDIFQHNLLDHLDSCTGMPISQFHGYWAYPEEDDDDDDEEAASDEDNETSQKKKIAKTDAEK